MADTKFESIGTGIGTILSGAAPVITAITGKQQGPQSVTYVTAPTQNSNSSIFMIGGVVIVVVLFIILLKQ